MAGARTASQDEKVSILQAYDTNKDGKIDAEEANALRKDYAEMMRANDEKAKQNKQEQQPVAATDAATAAEEERVLRNKARLEKHAKMLAAQQRALQALRFRYDKDGDGTFSDDEVAAMQEEVQTTDTYLRYLGYASNAARAVKYGRVVAAPLLAHHKWVLRSTFAISWGYVLGDVIFEADKARHVYGETKEEVLRGALDRLLFQSTASIVLPYGALRGVVGGARSFIQQRQKTVASLPPWAVRWGPQAVGLACIPMFPYLFDRPARAFAKGVMSVAWPKEDDES